MKQNEKCSDERVIVIKKAEKELPDFKNDPVYIRKLEQAEKTMREAPLPDFLLKHMDQPE